MTEGPRHGDLRAHEVDGPSTERTVYLLPQEALIAAGGYEVNLRELWAVVWSAKWTVLIFVVVSVALSVAYALMATQWYRAEVLLIPASERSGASLAGQLGGLSGLASLAGIRIGEDDQSVEALAVLRSEGFTRAFIESNQLLPVLFAKKWNASEKRWIAEDPEDWPDIHDAVRFFDRKVRRIQEDKKTGLVSLMIEWTDREIAAKWANSLAERVNEQMRQRALEDAQRNVDYLRSELKAAEVVTLQQAISRLLENELQKLMLARGDDEFAFRFVDRASPPKWRSWPKRAQVAILGTIAGGLIGLLFVLVRHFHSNSAYKPERHELRAEVGSIRGGH